MNQNYKYYFATPPKNEIKKKKMKLKPFRSIECSSCKMCKIFSCWAAQRVNKSIRGIDYFSISDLSEICFPINSPLQPRSSGAATVTPGWPWLHRSGRGKGAPWQLPAKIDQCSDLKTTAKCCIDTRHHLKGIKIYFTPSGSLSCQTDLQKRRNEPQAESIK